MRNGIIELDSQFGKEIGFTSDKFVGSYLWRIGKYIWISMIISRQEKQGNVRTLMDKINEKGFLLKVPTPSTRMQHICEERGMKYVLLDRKHGVFGMIQEKGDLKK